ncbi:hypothetical protein G6F42_022276 [Rhizopus arrhizus]|nr:hypothetical protein G6F42_022276 [Rhizopus arrhizus]
MEEEVRQETADSSSPSNAALLTPVSTASPTPSGSPYIDPSAPSSSVQVHSDRAPSSTSALANVETSTHALASTDSIDRIALCRDFVPLSPSSQSQNPSIGEKRANGEDQSNDASNSSTKKSKTDSNQSSLAFDFTSILDEAMKKFEQQMNSLNTKI